MTRQLKPYALREFSRAAWLPSDILAALGEPPHHRQGQLLIWATTARAAHEHAEARGLGDAVRSPRELAQAMGYDVQALHAAYPWPDGTILVTRSTGGGPVVEVTARQAGGRPNDKRQTCVIGHLGRLERPVFTPVDMSLVVTDAMVEAAWDALPGDVKYGELDISDVRRALVAALKARETQL